MENSDYPLLFQVADKGSISAQRYYLRLIKLELFVLILATIFSSIQVNQQIWTTIFPVITPVSLFIALIARLLTELIGFDKKWFSCRAIAESVKSVTWRYMTQAKPYNGQPDSDKIDREFLKNLKEIRNSQLEGAKKLGKQTISGNDVTQHMRAVRSKSFNERKSYYNKERVIDQKKWYSTKANINEKNRALFFWSSLVLEIIAVILAFLLLHIPSLPINPIAILIIIVATVTVWTQIKKHRELSQSYGLVVQELGQISSMYVHVDNEDKLSDYVQNVEDVISKEHTMWLAKREK